MDFINWKEKYNKKLVSAEKAVSRIKDNDKVYIGGASGIPKKLSDALFGRAPELKNVTVVESLALIPLPFNDASLAGHINVLSYFLGPQELTGHKAGTTDYSSVHFSQLRKWFKEVACPNVAFFEVTPPDEFGFMNIGPVCGSVFSYVLETAKQVIVQVNKNLPYVYGENNTIHIDDVEFIVEDDRPMMELPTDPISDVDKKIASHIVDLIPDGACIQLGFGGISNAVGYSLEHKKDLGVHTEMLTESMVYLAKKGVVNCSKKNFYSGRIVTAFGLGNTELYEFMDRNPMVYTVPQGVVNSVENIAKNDNFISINNALMVDLTGQVCSESVGFDQVSCTGGQLDFVRGAFQSKGGKSFIAIASTFESEDGVESRIRATLLPGAVVTTPRSDVQYVVTEYGCVNLWGQSVENRVKLLISIAHPDFREQLMAEAKEYSLIR